jgi:hypothetical protein
MLCGLYFISNACFVKYEERLTVKLCYDAALAPHASAGERIEGMKSWVQIFIQCRLHCTPCIIVLLIHYSTDRGVSFCFLNRYINYKRKELHYVVRTRSSGCFVIACPRWRGFVRVTIQLGRTQQHGSPEEMTDDHQIP